VGCEQVRTCHIKRSAWLLSRVKLTVPASHKRVDTTTVRPIQAIILRPFHPNFIGLDMDQMHAPISSFLTLLGALSALRDT
jgi:hypothetical protein